MTELSKGIKFLIKTKVGTDEEGEDVFAESEFDHRHIGQCDVYSGRGEGIGYFEFTLKRSLLDDIAKSVWTPENPKPVFIVGNTRISLSKFVNVDDYILTSYNPSEDVIRITAHHPGHKLNTVDLSEVSESLFEVIDVYSSKYIINNLLDGEGNPLEGIVWADFKSSFLGDGNDISLPSDAFRALGGKGCTSLYEENGAYIVEDFEKPGGGVLSSYDFNKAKVLTSDIRKYCSGLGYVGVHGNTYYVTGDDGPPSRVPGDLKFTYIYRKDEYEVIFHISVNESEEEEGGGIKYDTSVDWIEGTTEDLIRFILDLILRQDAFPQHFSPPVKRDMQERVKETYNIDELTQIYHKPFKLLDASYLDGGVPISEASIHGTDTCRLRMRLKGYAMDMLSTIATFTNREIYFTSEGFHIVGTNPIHGESDIRLKSYFYSELNEGQISIGESHLNLRDKLILTSDIHNVDEEDIPYIERYVSQPISESISTENIVASQGIQSENYKFYTRNIENTSSSAGRDIEFNIVDTGESVYRNRTVQLCALNALLGKQAQGTNVSYDAIELYSIQPNRYPVDNTYFDTIEEIESIEGPQVGDVALLDTGFDSAYYRYDGNNWSEYTPDSGRVLTYNPNDITRILEDTINSIILTYTPIRKIVRNYPTYKTEIVWGMEYSQDIRSRTKDLMSGYSTIQPVGSSDVQISSKDTSRIMVGNMPSIAVGDSISQTLYTGLIMSKDSSSNTYQLAGYHRGREQAKFNTEGKISAGAGAVILDEHGLRMEEDGISLSKDGLVFYDESHGTVTLNHKGMKLEDNSIPPYLQLKIDGTGIYDGENLLFINADGLTYDDVLVVSKNALHIKAHEGEGYDMSVDIKGEIDISDKQIDGGGVTLSNKGLVLEDIDGEAGSIILSNVDLDGSGRSKGLVALDPDGVTEQFSLTGRGLKLQDTFDKSMFMDSSGLSFEDTDPLDRDGLPTGKKSFIHMNASALTISQWMDIDNVEDYYEQVKLDGRGLSIHNDAIMIDRQGFRAKGVTINETGINIDRGGVVLNHDGLSFDQGVKLTSEGMSAGNGDVLLDKDGLTVYTDIDKEDFDATEALKFRKKGGTSSSDDLSRIYVTTEEGGVVENNTAESDRTVTNIRAYNEAILGTDEEKFGYIRIFNTPEDRGELKIKKTMIDRGLNISNSSPELNDLYENIYSQYQFTLTSASLVTFDMRFSPEPLKPSYEGELDKILLDIYTGEDTLANITVEYYREGGGEPITANSEFLFRGGGMTHTSAPVGNFPEGYGITGLSRISYTFKRQTSSVTPVILSNLCVREYVKGGTVEITPKGINLHGDTKFIGTIGGDATISNTIVESMMGYIIDKIYPVGSIYITTEEGNPRTKMGYGIWSPYAEGRTLVGAGQGYTAGNAGGANTRRIQAAHLPFHAHKYVPQGVITPHRHYFITDNASNHQHEYETPKLRSNIGYWGSSGHGVHDEYVRNYSFGEYAGGSSEPADRHKHDGFTSPPLEETYDEVGTNQFIGALGETGETGGNNYFDVRQRYIITYIWVRIG